MSKLLQYTYAKIPIRELSAYENQKKLVRTKSLQSLQELGIILNEIGIIKIIAIGIIRTRNRDD